MFNNSINIVTQEEMIRIYIDEFCLSRQRDLMMKGERYYKVENDIVNRKMFRYENEVAVEDETKTNNKLVHGFMHTLVDDKVNYLLSKPYTLSCEDVVYLDNVKRVIGKRFQKQMSKMGIEASNKGVGWLHPYVDSSGNFRTIKISSEEGIPLWVDNDHEELQAFIWFYVVEVYEGKEKKYQTKIEYWTPEGVTYYLQTDEGKVILDAEMYLDEGGEALELPHFINKGKERKSWYKVPFIPFKNNDFELPDIQFVKSLIDNYDLSRSDVSNTLEDVKNTIFALRGYGGEDLSEFLRDLSYYRAIKIDEDGGLETVNPNINIDAAKSHFEQLRKDIFDFGQGVDKNSDKLGNSPSGIALKFIYSGLDLKCNALEEWFKWSFEQLLHFVNIYLTETGEKVSDKEVSITFNRDIAINESQAITDCQNSKGVISDETIIKNHPWVESVEDEIKLLDEQNQSKEEDMFSSSDNQDVVNDEQ